MQSSVVGDTTANRTIRGSNKTVIYISFKKCPLKYSWSSVACSENNSKCNTCRSLWASCLWGCVCCGSPSTEKADSVRLSCLVKGLMTQFEQTRGAEEIIIRSTHVSLWFCGRKLDARKEITVTYVHWYSFITECQHNTWDSKWDLSPSLSASAL